MKNYLLFAALIATAVTGCLKHDEPDVPTGDDAVVVINEAYSRGKDGAYPLDWVEIYNKSDEAVDISGYVLSDKADMSERVIIPAGTTLQAHGFLMVVVDTETGFGLSSDGDVVYLYNDKGQNIDNVEFGPMDIDESWSANPDGSDTFEMRAPTPGKSNTEEVVTPPVASKVVINEAHSRGKDGAYPLDWVELYNDSDTDADISGYILSDKADMSEKVTIPAGTTLAARAFLQVVVDTETGFGLSSGGDMVFLYNKEGEEIDKIEFGAMEIDESWSANPDGSDTFEMMTPTPGASNTSGTGGGDDDPDYSKLFINEVKVSDFGADEQDWIEFYNAGEAAIDMAGLKIMDSGAEPFTIPAGNTIAAGGFIIFAEDAEGSFDFGLGKSGETVELLDAADNRIDFVDLTPAGELGDNAFPAYARTTDGGPDWAKTATPTKNASNTSAPASSDLAGKVVINEVYTFSDQATVDDLDWIELYNTTSATIDIGGLKLWEGGGSEEAWTIPAGKTIPANGRIVFESDKEGLHGDPANYPSWGLSKNGDMVVLADADLVIIDRVDVPLLDENQSYGRSSDGDSEWRKFAQHTKNAENEGPEPGVVNTTGVYVNEVYHDNTDDGAYRGIDPPLFDIAVDFIELYNSNDTPVDISGWEIYDDKMEDCYVIPDGTTIPAKGFLTYDVYKENTNGPTFGLGVGGDAIFLCTPGTGDIASRTIDRMEAVGFVKDADAAGGIGQRDFGYTVGRLTDGGDEIVIFVEGSKDASNNGKQVLQ